MRGAFSAGMAGGCGRLGFAVVLRAPLGPIIPKQLGRVRRAA